VAQDKKWFFLLQIQEGKTIMFFRTLRKQTIIRILQANYIAITGRLRSEC
jgi:hypothetical protein